jgi:predicted XRE-type DNA-binding protein
MNTTGNPDIVAGSGNIFADLGLPDAQDRLAKAELARMIGSIIRDRRLTQAAAAKILGIDQPKVSALATGRLSGFSLERLTYFLRLLGQDVEIAVIERPPSESLGQLTVVQGHEGDRLMQREEPLGAGSASRMAVGVDSEPRT